MLSPSAASIVFKGWPFESWKWIVILEISVSEVSILFRCLGWESKGREEGGKNAPGTRCRTYDSFVPVCYFSEEKKEIRREKGKL